LSTENDAGDQPKPPPGELAKGLAPLREQAGLPPGEGAELNARVLRVGLPRFPVPAQTLSLRVAELLQRDTLLFRMGKELGEIDPATGEWQAMDAHNFVTWIKNTANIMPWSGEYSKTDGAKIEASLGLDQARIILKSNDLRVKMPVIERIHHVKMPMLRDDGKIEMLRPGYDAMSKTFTTLGGPDYDEKMPFDEAVNLLWCRFQHFSWRNADRDWPIHLAAMLTMFCRGIYRGKSPMIIYNANIQESGKTTLAWFDTWVTHGTMYSRPLLEDQEKDLLDTMDTVAKERDPYLFFDNVDWGNKEVKSALLDEWLTKRDHAFRVKGVSGQHKTRLECVTILTANNCKVSVDLQRRSLTCDLWNPLPAAERPPLPAEAIMFDDEYFEKQDERAIYLAALYSLVRKWDEDGRPAGPGRPMGSFRNWSLVVPSIVWHAGNAAGGLKWDCLQPSGNEMIGDQTAREYRDLARRAIAEFGEAKEGGFRAEFEVSVAQLAGVARRAQIATEKLYPEKTIEDVRSTEGEHGKWKYKRPAEKFELAGDDDDGSAEEAEKNRQASEWLSAKSRSSFGIALMNNVHDRQFKGPDGFLYLFRHIANSAPTVYRVIRESAGQRPSQAKA
jgi:hypothetical protein